MSEKEIHQQAVAWLLKHPGYGQDLDSAPHCGVFVGVLVVGFSGRGLKALETVILVRTQVFIISYQ